MPRVSQSSGYRAVRDEYLGVLMQQWYLRMVRWTVACAMGAVLSALPSVATATPSLPAGAPNTVSGSVRDSDGRPAEADIALVRVGAPEYEVPLSGYCAMDGTYVIPLVPAGDYRVVFGAGMHSTGNGFPQLVPQMFPGRDLGYREWVAYQQGALDPLPGGAVHVPTSGPGPSGVDATLTLAPEAITGHVRDADGNPISGLTATLYCDITAGYFTPGESYYPMRHVRVEDDGTYAFRGLNARYAEPSGDPSSPAFMRYYVAFSDDASGTWNPQFYGGTQELSSATAVDCSGTPRVGIDATLTPAPVSVTGTVRNAVTGLPVGGARVSASNDASPGSLFSNAWAQTQDDGTYELRGLKSGLAYQIAAYKDDDSLPWDSGLAAQRTVAFAGAPVSGCDLALSEQSWFGPVKTIAWEDGWSNVQDELLDERWMRNSGTDYADVTDVVVTAGDAMYAREAACAPGLCWAYQVTRSGSSNLGKNAPLVAVSLRGDPLWAAQTIADIGLHNGTADHRVTLRVVGTKSSVSGRVLDRLRSYCAALGVKVTIDRLASAKRATRYELASAVAQRMRQRALANPADAIVWSGSAFIANGEHSNRVTGMAACSAVSASRGIPVLPVKLKSVPKPISRALKSLKLSPRRLYVIGDTKSVAEKVRKKLRVPAKNRLQGLRRGSNRFTVAAAVADLAIAKKWCSAKTVAVANEPLELIAGGAAVGDMNGVLLLASQNPYDSSDPTFRWLRSHKASVSSLWLVGPYASMGGQEYSDIFPSTLAGQPSRYAHGAAASSSRRQLSATARQRWRAAAATLGVR